MVCFSWFFFWFCVRKNGVAVAEAVIKVLFPPSVLCVGTKNGIQMTETVRVRMSSEPTKDERSLQTAKVSTATQPTLTLARLRLKHLSPRNGSQQ